MLQDLVFVMNQRMVLLGQQHAPPKFVRAPNSVEYCENHKVRKSPATHVTHGLSPMGTMGPVDLMGLSKLVGPMRSI